MNYLVFLQGRRAFQVKCSCVIETRLKDVVRVALRLFQVIELESEGIMLVGQLIKHFADEIQI